LLGLLPSLLDLGDEVNVACRNDVLLAHANYVEVRATCHAITPQEALELPVIFNLQQLFDLVTPLVLQSLFDLL